MKHHPIVVFLIAGTICLTGCETVQPWERGALARPEMQLDADPLNSQLLDQVYYSKEASSGGSQVAGAGCGCN